VVDFVEKKKKILLLLRKKERKKMRERGILFQCSTFFRMMGKAGLNFCGTSFLDDFL
jgi:hypothetical protein